MDTAEKVTGVQDLLERLRGVVESSRGPAPEPVRDVLVEALSSPGDWIEPAYQELGDEEFRLYPVYRDEHGMCSMLIAAVRPDTALPVHNHGSWAVIGVYRGRERDTWYRRVDDGNVPGKALLEVEAASVNGPGTVSILPDGKIHTVEALDGRPAVSIHVYGTDIVAQERSTFDLEAGTEEVFRPAFQATPAS